MATLRALMSIGAAIEAELRTSRDHTAAAGHLADLPAGFDIVQRSLAQLATAPPTEGLTLSCTGLTPDPAARNTEAPGRGPDHRPSRPPFGLVLHFLVTAWSADAARQQGLIAWAMLACQENPLLRLPDNDLIRLIVSADPALAPPSLWRSLNSPPRLCFSLTAGPIGLQAQSDAPLAPVTRIDP